MTGIANGIPEDRKPLNPDGRFTIAWYVWLQNLLPYNDAQLASYTVAGLPSSSVAGTVAYASDGRKPGEGAGHGTGVLVYYDSTAAWISVHSGVAVTA